MLRSAGTSSRKTSFGKERQLAVEYRPLALLIPYARNPRTHSEAQVAEIAASIREFGFTNPILVDGENGIIAGHGRLLAARQLGMTEVPVIELAGLTEAQKRAYVIADNKLTLNAGWDNKLLSLELGELEALGFDLSLTGFGDVELAGLLAPGTQGLTDPDAVPDAPEVPVTRSGDLWLLGKHRLLCGDSTEASDVERLLAGVSPHLMVTDPPYGVEYRPDWRSKAGVNRNRAKLGTVRNDDRADWREPGRSSPARSPMSGMPAASHRSCRRRWKPAASPSVRRSSGPRTASPSPAAIIIISMSLAGIV
jgi:hypothetical protein